MISCFLEKKIIQVPAKADPRSAGATAVTRQGRTLLKRRDRAGVLIARLDHRRERETRAGPPVTVLGLPDRSGDIAILILAVVEVIDADQLSVLPLDRPGVSQVPDSPVVT